MSVDMTDMLLTLQNSADSGPSPFGSSYYSDAITCGRKAQLNAANKAQRALDELEGEAVDPSDPDKWPSSLRVGIHLHKIMEARFKRQLGADAIWDARAETFNLNFRDALKIYRGFHTTFGSIEDYLGCEVVGAEVGLGLDQDRVKERLGGPFTGRADLVVNVVDPEKAHANTGLFVMPGRVIVDYKSGKAHGSVDKESGKNKDELKYVESIQCLGYLWLDELDRPEDHALSMVFLRMINHSVVNRKSFAAYMGLRDPNAETKLRNFIAISNMMRNAALPNVTACRDGWGRKCWFATNGTCQGI